MARFVIEDDAAPAKGRFVIEEDAPAKTVTGIDRFGKGLRDPIDGGAQLLTKALPNDWVKAGNKLNNWLADKTGLVGRLPEGGVDQQVRDAEAQYQQARINSTPQTMGGLVTGKAPDPGIDGYRLLGNVLNPANIAAASKLPQVASLVGRIGVGAGFGGASAALSPVTQGDFAEEKAKQIGIGAAIGGALPAVTNAVSRVISPNASRNADLQLLKSEGVTPTVGQTLGGKWNATEEKLQSLPIMGDAIANARTRAMQEFNQAAINRATGKVGVKVEGSGQKAIKQAGDEVSNAYEDALSQVKNVSFDSKFSADIGQLRGMAQSLVPDMRSKFNKTLENVVMGRMSNRGSMVGDSYKKVDSELGSLAARYGKSNVASEQELGDALLQVQNLLKQQVMRSNPKVAEKLAAADDGWANLVRLEGAAKAAANSDGVFTPAQLNASIRMADDSVRKRAVSRGTALMQDIGRAGQNVIGNKIPNSFTTDRALIAGGGLGLGALNLAIPAGLLGGAAMYSKPMQGLLSSAISSRPQSAKAIADALNQYSAGLLPLGVPLGLPLGLELSK